MLKDVYHAVVYIAVPVIMLLMLMLSLFVTARVPREYRLSSVAGLFAGFVAFAIYVVSSFSDFRSPTLGLDAIPTFKWLPIVIGAAIGFGLLLLGQFLDVARPGLVGLFVCFGGTSSMAGFSYFFARRCEQIRSTWPSGACLGYCCT